ncbi:MAG: hypothetical protein K6F57_00025 [Candidatus Saccharibacteria bacterium]|nr:hypothetical protein [Candidatus Saccharibacteria bacterium]
MEFLATADTFEMNGTALFLIIIGGIIIWLIMTFIFANMDSGAVELIMNKDKRAPKGIEFVDVEDNLRKEKEKAYQEKKNVSVAKSY